MSLEPFGPDPMELAEKERRLRRLLTEHKLDALVLARLNNFAWATGGRDCAVFFAGEKGEAQIVLTSDDKFLLVPNVEAARLAAEEELEAQGYRLVVHPWWQPGQELARVTRGKRWGADCPYPGALDLAGEVARLRWQFTPAEQERFRWLGRASAEALEAAARSAAPGLTERQLMSNLATECLARQVAPVLMLVGSDERLLRYRHPVATAKPIESDVMLVLCGRRWGLIASATRLVHVGPLPAELKRRAAAVAHVDATLIAATRPGRRACDIFAQGARAYAEAGYPEEWQHHHQGGLAGYAAREYLAQPDCQEVVQVDQAFAWNPSLSGVKSEDTFLLTLAGREFLTVTGDWPYTRVSIENETIDRPSILQMG